MPTSKPEKAGAIRATEADLTDVVESKKALAQRIRHIVTRPLPKTAWVGIVGLILVLLAGCVLLPMAKTQKEAADKIHGSPGPGVVVSGRIQNEAGEPLAGARVLVYYGSRKERPVNRTLAEVRTDTNGSFSIEYVIPPLKTWLIDAEDYPQLTLVAAHPDYAPNGYRLSRDRKEDGITITLEPGRGPFRVYVGEGMSKKHPPIEGATVWIPTAFKVGDDDLNRSPHLPGKSSPVYNGKHGFSAVGNLHVCEATTGTNGWAEFSHVPLAGIFVDVAAPGFSDNYRGTSEVRGKSATLYLWPEGRIAGTVASPDGPVTGGVVWAEAKWSFHFDPCATVQVDGSFILTGLHVQGWAPEWCTLDGASGKSGASGKYAVRYEPGGTDRRWLVGPVDVTLSATNPIATVALNASSEGVLVTGRMYNAETGQGFDAQTIGFHGRDAQDKIRKVAVTDRDGRFSLLLPGGAYYYWLQLKLVGAALDPDRNTIRLDGYTADLTVSPKTKPLDIPLYTIPVGALTVKVLDAQGAPATNAEVLLMADREQGVRFPWKGQHTDSNGVCRTADMPVKGGIYVLARSVDRKQAVCSSVDLADAMRPEGVTLRMGPAIEFDVKVEDNGKPVPNETVCVYFMTGGRGRYENGAEAKTDTNGIVRMTGLPFGYDLHGILGQRNGGSDNQRFQLPAGFKKGQFLVEKDHHDNILWCRFAAQDGSPASGVKVRLDNSWELGGLGGRSQTNKPVEQAWTTGTNGEIKALGYTTGLAELSCTMPTTTRWYRVEGEEGKLRWEGDKVVGPSFAWWNASVPLRSPRQAEAAGPVTLSLPDTANPVCILIVKDAEGHPVPDAVVSLLALVNAKEEPLGVTDRTGTLAVKWREKGFVPMQFVALVRRAGFALGYVSQSPWLTTAEVTLRPAFVFSTVVRNDEGMPVGGARVRVINRSEGTGKRRSERGSERVSLARNPTSKEEQPGWDFVCDGNGRFTIPDTHLGEWLGVNISHPDYVPHGSGFRVKDKVSDVVDDQGKKVFVLDKGGVIEGRLQGYEGDGSDIGVRLMPAKPYSNMEVPVIEVSDGGRFNTKYVPRGDYWAVATHSPKMWEAMSEKIKKHPELRSSLYEPPVWVSLPVAVNVAGGTNSVPDMVVKRGTRIRVQVVDAATQRHVPEVAVRTVPAGVPDDVARQLGPYGITGTNGIAELRVLPGEITLRVDSYRGELGELKTPRTERFTIPQAVEPYDVRLPLDLTPTALQP